MVEKRENDDFQPIRIIEVIVDEISTPINAGTRGSSLYSVPFRLSCRPPYEWEQMFIQSWNHPPTFTSRHRPGIASVIGDKVILDGTTIEEVEKYHRSTLIQAVEEANRQYQKFKKEQCEQLLEEQKQIEAHKKNIQEEAKRLKFD